MPRFSITGASVRCALAALAIGYALLLPGITGFPRAQATSTENAARAVWIDPDLITTTSGAKATDESELLVLSSSVRSWMFIEASPHPDRPDHSLLVFQAVEQMLDEGHIALARRLLDTVDRKKLDPLVISYLQLLDAKTFYMSGNYQATLRSLQKLRLSDLTTRQTANLAWLRMAALLGLQRIPEALMASQNLQSASKHSDIAITGYRLLWKTLKSLPISKLAELHTTKSNAETIAWAELVELVALQLLDRKVFTRQLQAWTLRYSSHPANRYVLGSFPLGGNLTDQRPQQVALLLPLTSAYEEAANAVRDGFLMLWRKDTSVRRPQIRIYDYGDQMQLVNAYYDAAVRDKADFIIGPLGTTAVQQIRQRQSFDVPTLLLGNLDPDSAPRPNTYQFSLAPEDEATSVAKRAFADGHRQASVLYPDTARGNRIFASWSKTWRELGGVITNSRPYDIKVSDHTQIIRTLFNFDHSTERRETLQEILGPSAQIKFSVRRRQDIDALFLFGDSNQTRLMKPQIDFHHAHELPVYGLSSIYSGKPDSVKDLDLEGVIFGDMPWLLTEGGQVESLRESLSQNELNIGSGMERLFALGLDAFALMDKVSEMQRNPDWIYPGITGDLSVTSAGKILRNLEWARIKNAEPLHLRLATLPIPPRVDLKSLLIQRH